MRVAASFRYVLQHERAAEDEAAGVGPGPSREARCGAVGGFEESQLFRHVHAGSKAEAADLRGEGVRNVVAVQVGRGEHAVLLGADEGFLKHRVGQCGP